MQQKLTRNNEQRKNVLAVVVAVSGVPTQTSQRR